MNEEIKKNFNKVNNGIGGLAMQTENDDARKNIAKIGTVVWGVVELLRGNIRDGKTIILNEINR